MKCMIIEDERLAQQVIANHIQRYGRLELVGTCSNVQEARNILDKEAIELMFLDIQLPGITGLQLLRSLNAQPLVILTTAYPDYAVESYEYNVADYLLKPISFERFSKAVNKIMDGSILPALKHTDQVKADHIFVRSNGRFCRVNFADIQYIEGMRDYLKIYTASGQLIIHQTMQEMETILPAGLFRRIHRSYIVSLDQIRRIYGNYVETGSATIPIGASYREQVMQLVGKK